MVTIIKRGMKEQEIHSLVSSKKNKKKKINLKKYCGKIVLKEDAVNIQKRFRDEWQ